MAVDLLVDTSGLYALADHRDPSRAQARKVVASRVSAGSRLVITDYVLDEV